MTADLTQHLTGLLAAARKRVAREQGQVDQLTVTLDETTTNLEAAANAAAVQTILDGLSWP
jgi:hypothetical protein